MDINRFIPARVPHPQHPLTQGGYLAGANRPDGTQTSFRITGTPAREASIGRRDVDPQWTLYRRDYPEVTSRAVRDAIKVVDDAVALYLDAPAPAADAVAGARAIGRLLTFRTIEDSRSASRGTYRDLVAGHAPSEAVAAALIRLDDMHERLVPKPNS